MRFDWKSLAIALCTASAVSCSCPEAPAREGAGVLARLELAEPIDWTPRFRGIDFAEMPVRKPARMHGYAVRIDLREPGVRFTVTRANGDRDKETDGLTTGSFLAKSSCQVAINANPFAPVHNDEGQPHDVLGLLVREGETISGRHGKMPALLIGRANTASIAEPPFKLDGVEHAVGGFSVILRSGEIVAAGDKRHPRTAAGISAEGRYLYLLVIDGRQSFHSVGASTRELAQWLLALGASEGINLDGGGTSTLVMEDARGAALVVNRPVHRGRVGLQRPSAAHLGVFAERIGR